jgi:hypothetical protein
VPGGRRPTVAVLDTGVADHPWFAADPADPILVDPGIVGWESGTTDAKYRWHGTFVAGVVRQAAPDARILSVQLRQDAGEAVKVAQGEILRALRHLRDRLEPHFVDVVCLAVGYEDPDGQLAEYTAEVRAEIERLGTRGVVVVAAAGNRRTEVALPDNAAGLDERTPDPVVYPAALADPTLGSLPAGDLIVAVRAVDPDGHPAAFSPCADWMAPWPGVDVLGPVPSDPTWWSTKVVNLLEPEHPDLYDYNFGRGSGTSYAAAGLAGHLAQLLLDGGGPVDDTSPQAARQRALRALATAGVQV